MISSDRQANAEAEQFLLTQRQTIYSKALLDEADAYAKVENFQAWLNEAYGTPTDEDFVTRTAAGDLALRTLYGDYVSVRLVGLNDTADSAQRLYHSYAALYGVLTQSYKDCSANRINGFDCATPYTHFNAAEPGITSLREEFIAAARGEIQG
jgi:hypothetical protein